MNWASSGTVGVAGNRRRSPAVAVAVAVALGALSAGAGPVAAFGASSAPAGFALPGGSLVGTGNAHWRDEGPPGPDDSGDLGSCIEMCAS